MPYPNKPKDNTNPKTGSNSENCSMAVAIIIIFFLYLKLRNLKSKVLYLKFLVNFYTLPNMHFYKFYLVIFHLKKKRPQKRPQMRD